MPVCAYFYGIQMPKARFSFYPYANRSTAYNTPAAYVIR